VSDAGASTSGGASNTNGGVSGGFSASGGIAGAAGGGVADDCTEPRAASVPLRRLTPFEYDNTLRDLFGLSARRATELFAQLIPNGRSEEPVTAAEVEAYHRLAHALASELSSDPQQLSAAIGCDPALSEESICREQLIGELLPRMFRAPLTDDVRNQMEAVFTTGEELGASFASGVRAVLEVALQSPEFLYRVEFGEAAPDLGPAMGRPLPHEMAVRLSYFLRGAPPDAELSRAAELGQLQTKAQIATQARRLLREPGAHDVVRQFYLQHLGLLAPDLAAHAELGSDVAQLMVQETTAFIDDVTFGDEGDLNALLTAPFTWLNGPLAQHYGVAGVTGSAFQRVEVDSAERAGLLTQGLFLASTSSAGSSSPSRRGVWVRRNLLCAPIPSSPPGIDQNVPPVPGLSTRERFEQAVNANVNCVTCHRFFDPIGFTLEHFDAVGRYRETEAGKPIDASGEIVDSDVQGPVDGASELASRLASSVDVRDCYADGWLTFAYGRPFAEEDACSREALHAAFAEAKGNVLELLVAVTQTDGFLYRPLSEVAP